ncbi:hypothetical protein GLW05_10890 [Pontibacillus yanchengensis]|uniref:Uncharacterized protein n=1 Tax=Pontibacillus yanchengensis TaxID=462910 RepID=A0A6I5A193_9BACI|nr:hypothetical protein [Pontibacillus yanchengensis]MYL34103.1 hypothetical protein [Pontibacillus yanchengensis]
MQKRLVLSLSLSSIIVWGVVISMLFVQGETYKVIPHSEKEQYHQMTKASMDPPFLKQEDRNISNNLSESKQVTKRNIEEVGLTKEWVAKHTKDRVLSINKLLASLEIYSVNPLSSN